MAVDRRRPKPRDCCSAQCSPPGRRERRDRLESAANRADTRDGAGSREKERGIANSEFRIRAGTAVARHAVCAALRPAQGREREPNDGPSEKETAHGTQTASWTPLSKWTTR